MNYQSSQPTNTFLQQISQPTNTFLQQRPPPVVPTDCFYTYTRISSQCKTIDRIADSIDPFELANNPNQIPSSNIAQEVHHSVNTLYEIQKSIFSSLTPTQTTLLTVALREPLAIKSLVF
jgi:hypothetical protein